MKVLLEEAQNPQTPPERLKALASRPEAEVRRAVAANPNTPEEVLWRLAVHFPEAVLSNPVLELFWLLNANWLAEMPGYARSRLLACPEASLHLLRWALKEGDTQSLLSVLQNPRVPGEFLEALADHPLPAVAEAARLHVGFESEPLEAALEWCEADMDYFELRQLVLLGMAPPWLASRIAQESDTALRLALLEQADLPPTVLQKLLFDDEEEVRQAARAHPKAPAEQLQLIEQLEQGLPVEVSFEALAQGSAYVRALVAKHPQTPRPLLERLIADDDWQVRVAAASNPRIPKPWLEPLARDGDRAVREAVAANPRATSRILGQLMADEYEEVRQAATHNPHSPWFWDIFDLLEQRSPSLYAEHLDLLARQGPYCRRLVMAHPHVPTKMLEDYRAHPDPATRLAIAQNPKTPPGVLAAMAHDPDPEVRQAVASHPQTPLPGLERLAQDKQPDVRMRVAENPRTPGEVLQVLAQDDHWPVRQAVAQNPSTPTEALRRLGQDPDTDVQQAVADHPNAPEEALEAFFSGWVFPANLDIRPGELYRRVRRQEPVPPEWLETLARGPERARRLVAAHPEAPPSTLLALAQDEDWRVRQAVAQRPALPAEVLVRLATDSDVDVRRAAYAHPQAGARVLEQVRPEDPQDIRLLVARHPQAPLSSLRALMADPDEEVRQAAWNNPRTPPDWLEQYRQAETLDPQLDTAFLRFLAAQQAWGRALAAQHPATPLEVLQALQKDEDWSVRQALARNPALPAEMLTQMAQDADRDVRLAVAQHPHAPPEALQGLLQDPDEEVRLAALRNPSLPATTLAAHRVRLGLQASRSRFVLNRAVALAWPGIPPLELAKVRHWAAPEWLVRYAVAQNPNTPVEVLERLAQDGNRLVRNRAVKSLGSRAGGL